MSQWRKMTYSPKSERWGVHMDGWFAGYHCGESLVIRIGDKGVECRMEYDQEWYVIMKEARFNLRKKDTYQVIY
jgi:hypothetical protein